MVCSALRKNGVTKDIDVHLMVEPVDDMIGAFADAGASYITFHPEASNHVDRSLSLIRERGCKAGLVFTPSTSLDYAKYVLDKCDIILLMSGKWEDTYVNVRIVFCCVCFLSVVFVFCCVCVVCGVCLT